MPLVSESEVRTSVGLGEPLGAADLGPEDPVSVSQLFADAFVLENPIGSLSNLQGIPSVGVQNPDFPRFEGLEGYEEFAGEFGDVDTPEEHAALRARIDDGRERRRRLANGGAVGIIAGLSAGLLDPLNFVPIGGGAIKAFKAGSLLKGAVLTAGAAAGGASASEFALHASQFDRTLEESAYNVAGATFLGGVIGSASAGLSKIEFNRIAKELIEEDLGPKGPTLAGGSADATLPISSKAVLADSNGVPRTGAGAIETEAANVIPGLKKAAGLEKISPAGRQIFDSPIAAPKVIVAALAEIPFKMKENLAGLATGRLGFKRIEGTALDPEKLIGLTGRVRIKAPPSIPRTDIEKAADVAGAVRAEQTRLKRSLTPEEARAIRAGVEATPPTREPSGVIGEEAAPEPLPFPDGTEVEVIARVGELDLETGAGRTFIVKGPDGEEFEIATDRLDIIGAPEQIQRAPIGGVTREQEALGTFEIVAGESRISAEGLKKLLLPRLALARESWRQGYRDYSLRVGKTPISLSQRQTAERILGTTDRRGKPMDVGNLTQRQYRELVGFAARSGDELPIRELTAAVPEAGQAARQIREALFDPTIDDAIRLKLSSRLSDQTADSYLPRLWDIQALMTNRDVFKQRAMEWARGELGVGESQGFEVANAIFEKITHMAGGRTDYGALDDLALTGGLASSLQNRAFTIKDSQVSEFLVSDIDQLSDYYWKTMSADLAIAERFGDVEMSEAFEALKFGYNEAIAKATTDLPGAKNKRARDKRIETLESQRERSVKDITAMRDRLRGTFGAPPDPNSLRYRSLAVMRGLNVMAQLGGAAVSSVPDLGRHVMVHGLTRSFKTGVQVLANGIGGIKANKVELQRMGVGWEFVLDSRSDSMFDLGDHWRGGSKFEDVVHSASSNFAMVNLLTPWNHAMKQAAGFMTQDRTLDAVLSVARGETTKRAAKELGRLADLGIDVDGARRIAAMFDQFGDTRRARFKIANTDLWTDRRAVELFRGSTTKEVDRVIVTPGIGDKPLIMSGPVGQTFFQYKSFAVAATQRVLVSGLQQRDAAFANGLLVTVGLGMMVYAAKQGLAGKELADDPATWIREGVDRSGTTGVLTDFANILDKVNLGPSRLLGIEQPSRYASRNALQSVAGPTFGLAQTGFQIAGAVSVGEFTESEAKSVRRLLPYHQLFYLRGIMSALGLDTVEMLDLKSSSKRRRDF